MFPLCVATQTDIEYIYLKASFDVIKKAEAQIFLTSITINLTNNLTMIEISSLARPTK